MTENEYGWSKYAGHNILYPHARYIYRKKIHNEVFATIVEYGKDTVHKSPTWEMDIQISDDVSPTGMTINIKSFTYRKLDFVKIEKDAVEIIKKLIK